MRCAKTELGSTAWVAPSLHSALGDLHDSIDDEDYVQLAPIITWNAFAKMCLALNATMHDRIIIKHA